MAGCDSQGVGHVSHDFARVAAGAEAPVDHAPRVVVEAQEVAAGGASLLAVRYPGAEPARTGQRAEGGGGQGTGQLYELGGGDTRGGCSLVAAPARRQLHAPAPCPSTHQGSGFQSYCPVCMYRMNRSLPHTRFSSRLRPRGRVGRRCAGRRARGRPVSLRAACEEASAPFSSNAWRASTGAFSPPHCPVLSRSSSSGRRRRRPPHLTQALQQGLPHQA